MTRSSGTLTVSLPAPLVFRRHALPPVRPSALDLVPFTRLDPDNLLHMLLPVCIAMLIIFGRLWLGDLYALGAGTHGGVRHLPGGGYQRPHLVCRGVRYLAQ